MAWQWFQVLILESLLFLLTWDCSQGSLQFCLFSILSIMGWLSVSVELLSEKWEGWQINHTCQAVEVAFAALEFIDLLFIQKVWVVITVVTNEHNSVTYAIQQTFKASIRIILRYNHNTQWVEATILESGNVTLGNTSDNERQEQLRNHVWTWTDITQRRTKQNWHDNQMDSLTCPWANGAWNFISSSQ